MNKIPYSSSQVVKDFVDSPISWESWIDLRPKSLGGWPGTVTVSCLEERDTGEEWTGLGLWLYVIVKHLVAQMPMWCHCICRGWTLGEGWTARVSPCVFNDCVVDSAICSGPESESLCMEGCGIWLVGKVNLLWKLLEEAKRSRSASPARSHGRAWRWEDRSGEGWNFGKAVEIGFQQ